MFTRPTLTLLALLATSLLAASPASALDATTSEKLGFEVRWRDARVATINLNTGCARAKHRPAALIATTRGFADDLYSFFIRFDSFFDPDTHVPFQGRSRITEDGRTRRYTSTFEKGPQVSVDATIFGEDRDPTTHALPRTTHDMLSWMLHLRWRHDDWREGATRRYTIWDGWKLFDIEASIGARRQLVTPMGTYETWPVSLSRYLLRHEAGEDQFTRKGETRELGTLWLTTGGDHVLVGMDFHSRLGTVEIRLLSAARGQCKK